MSMTTEYVDELIAKSTPVFIQSLQSIFFEESKLCKNKKYLLRDFQTRLENIATWSPEVIQEEFLRFQHMSRCDWLDKLIHVSIVSMADRISSNEFNENMLVLPDKAIFIHKCYVNIAREVWRKPIIMYTGAKSKDKIRYTHELKEFIRKSIVSTIREFIPFDKLISTVLSNKRYSLQKEGESVSVEDVTSSDSKQEEPLMITQRPLYLEGGEPNPDENSVKVIITGKEFMDSENTYLDSSIYDRSSSAKDVIEEPSADETMQEAMEEDANKEETAVDVMHEDVDKEGSTDEIMDEDVVKERSEDERMEEVVLEDTEESVAIPEESVAITEESAAITEESAANPEEPAAIILEEPTAIPEEPAVTKTTVKEDVVHQTSTEDNISGGTKIILQEDSDSDEVGEIEITLQDNLEDLKFKLKKMLSRDTNGIELKRKNKKKLVREMLKNRSVLYVQ